MYVHELRARLITGTPHKGKLVLSYCQKPVSTDGLSENHEKIILWVVASISWTVAPFAILMNALVVIVVSQRKELQKTSNILLSSIALADFLTDIASIPAITTTILIVHQGSLEFLRTINKVAVNLEGFFIFCSLYHLTVVAWESFVAVRKWMHYNVIMAKQRIIKFAIFAWFLTIFAWLPLYVMTFAIEDSKARRIWIMIVNFFEIVNVLSSPISSYAMIYNGVRKRRTSNMNNSTALAQAKRHAI